MDGRRFTTPDRTIEAARSFSSEGFERSFEEVLHEPVPAFRESESGRCVRLTGRCSL